MLSPYYIDIQVVLQLLSCVWIFATLWTVAHQAFLSFTISQSLLKLMPIESVVPSNHLILCHPLLLLPSIFPSINISMSWFFASGSQSIGTSASAPILPMNQSPRVSFCLNCTSTVAVIMWWSITYILFGLISETKLQYHYNLLSFDLFHITHYSVAVGVEYTAPFLKEILLI